MKNNTWNLQDAQTKFNQLVEYALLNEPQFVTKHGNSTVVVLSYEQYEKITQTKPDLVSFFKNSPLREVDLEVSRSKNFPRNLDL